MSELLKDEEIVYLREVLSKKNKIIDELELTIRSHMARIKEQEEADNTVYRELDTARRYIRDLEKANKTQSNKINELLDKLEVWQRECGELEERGDDLFVAWKQEKANTTDLEQYTRDLEKTKQQQATLIRLMTAQQKKDYDD